MTNVMPLNPTIDGAIVGRPGFRVMDSDTQLGSGSTRKTQRVFRWTTLAGVTYTIGFCGGLMYTYDWSTRQWLPLCGVINTSSPTASGASDTCRAPVTQESQGCGNTTYY